MSSQSDIEGGLSEMKFSMVRSTPTLEVPSSKPATYTFQGDTSLDVDGLEAALDEYDFNLHRVNSGLREDGDFYCYATVLTDHYKDVRIKIWRETARIYPQDEEPDKWEMTRIVKSIEEAFGAEMKHTPEEA